MGLDDVLAGAPVSAVYQPVVRLDTGDVLGYEALARGARPPEELLRQAREHGCAGELDWQCRTAAMHGALEADLGNTLTLFVNVEPDSDVLVPPVSRDVCALAESSLRVVLEIAERAVVQRPAELLRLVDWARERSWGIAVTTSGRTPRPWR